MKRLAMTLCLLGALGASADNTAPYPDPIECQRLCNALRVVTLRPDISLELRAWFRGGNEFGCDWDAYAYHTALECGQAQTWIERWDHYESCFHFWDVCYWRTAECMRTHPYWDTCFCGHPGDGC